MPKGNRETATESQKVQNAQRRAPIVFCLDISPSMGKMHWSEIFRKDSGMRISDLSRKSSIEKLNKALRYCVDCILQDATSAACAEIAFVTFSANVELINGGEFKRVRELHFDNFEAEEEGSSQLSQAVYEAYCLMERHMKELRGKIIPYYQPQIVVVTDGDPDKTDSARYCEMAKDKIREHMNTRSKNTPVARTAIRPVFIAIGEPGTNYWDALSELKAAAIPTDPDVDVDNGRLLWQVYGTEKHQMATLKDVFKYVSNSTTAQY